MIKAILLDIDNTLLDFQKCSRAVIREGFARIGEEYNENVHRVFTEINDSLWDKIERGELTRERLHEIRWGLVFDKLNLKQDGRAFEQYFLDGLTKSHEPVDGAMELLEYLSPRYTLCAASNAFEQQQLTRLRSAGMLKYFTHTFISESLGFSKPSAEFFNCCMQQLGDIAKDEVMMIGDSLTADIRGGVSFGVVTCWYNHHRQTLPPDLKPDYVVDSLSEIKGIL